MTGSAYDDIAEWYDEWVGGGRPASDPMFAEVVPLLGDVSGRRVCDLACGQGRVARYLADRGARVVGVDISSRMLAIARRYEVAEPRGIEFVRADARGLAAIVDDAFEGVVCHMALMDVPDLIPTVQAVSRVLRSGGWFVFSIIHPCYNTASAVETVDSAGRARRVVGDYFVEGFWRLATRIGPPGKIGAYHRTLSTYVNTLIEAGLVVERMAEPRASGDDAERRPVWAEVPGTLIVRCRRS